jgi:hypothetical protein
MKNISENQLLNTKLLHNIEDAGLTQPSVGSKEEGN